MNRLLVCYIFIIAIVIGACTISDSDKKPISYSGIYPNLAMYNNEGECGTGAVVPWADRLWVITYGPHLPNGSSDKLYEITSDLKQIVRPESIGGTPANRMIHKESNQLFIGPYAIDATRNVRVIPYDVMPGRHTGNARHLTDPSHKIYYATMEEGFYEVDVNSLKVKTLYQDANSMHKEGDMSQSGALLPGAHGKGLYSGQGVMVYSDNGEANKQALEQFDVESGSLHEWNGKYWKLIQRKQFVEVTGPGGIYGNKNPETDPIWATGWDNKSVILETRDHGDWIFYRLPKASHCYDGAHGWNTEWPRIRDVGTADNPEYLMTMHGMFWHFPETFSKNNSAGIRPRSAYLKVIGDYARWNDRLVFGCDDSANKEFLNKRKAKGDIEGPGQSNSNIWFTSVDQPDDLGPTTAEGAVWLSEDIQAKEVSDPFLFSGWKNRSAWIYNEGKNVVSFKFEVDKKGNGTWSALKTIKLKAGEAFDLLFSNQERGEWVRVSVDRATHATVHFYYADEDHRGNQPDDIFNGLAQVDEAMSSAGLLWGLADNRRSLGILAGEVNNSQFNETAYYELDAEMNLVKKDDPETSSFIREKFAFPKDVISIDEASVLIVDDRDRRWRLPKGNNQYNKLIDKGLLRICREIATERDLFNCAGTFYELPAENADGYAKIRPVASHNFRIYDYASYRGMLIMTGLKDELPQKNEHIIKSEDGQAAVWAGVIDDLWKMGKPIGEGGPWKNSDVKAGEPSDPYLIGFYDKRSLKLTNESDFAVKYEIQVEPVGHGPWMTYKEVSLNGGETFDYIFPDEFQSRWIRFIADKGCKATAWLKYK